MGPTPPAVDAAVVVAPPTDGGPPFVDLFRTVSLEVEVSSRVANSKIKLEHLVDRDLKTAWNSRTDALNNSISIEIPKDVTVHEVRMTVGHTGTGPKGEDYFTMNRRITKVRVSGKFDKLEKPLDPNQRGLQVIAVPPHTDGTLTIHIEDWVDGSKKNWKEICVSEVELWGTAAKPTPNAKPRVHEAMDAIAERLCDGKITPDAWPTPECSVFVAATSDLDGNPFPKPWTGVGVIDLVTGRVEHHGHVYSEGIDRSLVLVAGAEVWTSDAVLHSSYDAPGDGTKTEHTELTLDEVRAKGKKLVIRYTVKDPQRVPASGVPSFEITCSLDKTCESPVALPVAVNE